MCTAISDRTNGFLFGRTLDLELSYGERIILTPRRKELEFLHLPPVGEHPAILGIGILHEGSPLYFDAINESGLAIAALNFPKSAVYREKRMGACNLASFEIIPYILSHCTSLELARKLLENINITNESVSDSLPASPLHWLISDRDASIVLESTADGVRIYDDPFDVLANEPPFPYHLAHTASFSALSSTPPENKLSPDIELPSYSRGMGAFGLPGDFSSASRFVRAVFIKNHTDIATEKFESVSRFFHIMGTLSVPRGTVKTDDGASVYTVYTSCAAPECMTYYLTTYASRYIRAISPSADELNKSDILSVSTVSAQKIFDTSFT